MNQRRLFVDSVRDGDWITAMSAADGEWLPSSLSTPSSSVCAWLIELNAPSGIVLALLKKCVQTESIDPDRLALLELCMRLSNTNSNAIETFKSLLAFGLSANILVDGGSTLLQKAIELNKCREVELLLRHGADPRRTSAFGQESTSNLEEATRAENDAGTIALAWFTNGEHDKGPEIKELKGSG